MSKVAKIVGSVVDSAFGTSFTAVEVADLPSQVRRIVFQSPKLRGEQFRALSKVEIHVGGGNFRSYTPARLDSEEGTMTLLIHLHSKGVGSSWAETLKPGSTVKGFGPEGSVKANLHASTHVCFGDETTLGAFLSLQSCLPPGALFYGAVELKDAAVLSEIGLDLTPITKAEETSLVAWIKSQKPFPPDSQVYLLGRAKSILRVRDYLVTDLNFSKSAIRKKAYWADGKRGL
jgi:NADPH-dependent ferric siderophore reductase